MALKKDIRELDTDIRHFCNATAERGVVVSVSTGGSGVSMDGPSNACTVATDPSGKTPLGVLLYDVVNYDLTKQRVNELRYETQISTKVTILMKGSCTTNKIIGTPSAGNTCYLAASGNVSATQATGAPSIGRFVTSKDSDGYATIEVNLP